MATDIKAEVTKLVEKIGKDETLKKEFQNDPLQAVKKLIGVELPDDVVQQIVTGVKGKLTVDQVSGAVDTLKKLF
jgi:hypothetical protein